MGRQNNHSSMAPPRSLFKVSSSQDSQYTTTMHAISSFVLPWLVLTATMAQDTATRSLISFDKLAPRSNTDDSCSYSFAHLSCIPSNLCSYHYKFGDLTPSQSCRIKLDVDGTRPHQIHLGYAGTIPGTGMTISWTTFTKVIDPMVWIGSSASTLELTPVNVEVVSYYSDSSYSLYNYHATITGLSPHTTYTYQVGSNTSANGLSEVSSFTTARSTNDTNAFDVVLYGDMGVDDGTKGTINYLTTKLPGNVDFVYHVGDISYADNAGLLTATEVLGFFYEQTYNNFMNLLTPLTTHVPYMVLPGNHEAECHSVACIVSSSKRKQLGNYTAYNTRFRMPSTESGGVKNMWYSFEHGPIHFTSISSETDYTGAPKNSFIGETYGDFGNQLAWLEADLQKADANRANVPWLIVTMHRAMYTRTLVDKDGNPIGEAAPVQKAFEDLFLKYHVDVVVSAHVHLYERQLPIQHGKPVLDGVSEDKKTYTKPKAPVYLITGAAGSNEGHDKFDVKKTAAWHVVIDNTNFGISKVHVTCSSLQWQFVAVANDTIIDEFTITK